MNNNQFNYTVCIHCMTYNHKPYILDALHGFAMQQTGFPYVALVMDDASTDGEPEVLRQYILGQCDADSLIKKETDLYELAEVNAKDNPHCHFAFYFLKENQFRTGKKKPIIAEWDAQAKYIALCEGDDYWTDSYKLQKQVDFLESHPDYSMCFHSVKIFEQTEKRLVPDNITIEVSETSDIYKLAECDFIHTNTVLYRNDERIRMFRAKIGSLPIGDYPLWMACAKFGLIYKFHDEMSVYRRNSTSIWATKPIIYKNNIKMQVVKRFYELFFADKQLNTIFASQYVNLAINQAWQLYIEGKGKVESIKILLSTYSMCQSVKDIKRVSKRIIRIIIAK